VENSGFKLDNYRELSYFEPLKVAIAEEDMEKIDALILEYDEFLEKNKHLIAESPGPGYQASLEDEPAPIHEKGIHFKKDPTVTLKHSLFKREMYISKRLMQAEIEIHTTNLRYNVDDVFEEAYAIIKEHSNV